LNDHPNRLRRIAKSSGLPSDFQAVGADLATYVEQAWDNLNSGNP
jgi:hypothetical protein